VVSDKFLTLSDGYKYAYADQGEGDPLLMVHGNPTWSYYYRNLIKTFSPTFRCVAPDHIGCGNSDKPQDYPYRLEKHIQNLEYLVEKLDLKDITLVIHDWGGAIGMGMATRHPERIKRIVILNTAAFLMDRIPFRINICRIPVFGAIAIRGFNAFAASATFMAVHDKMSSEVKKEYVRPYNNWKNRIATLRFVQDIPMSPSHPTWSTVREIEEKLSLFKNTPKLLCWGMEDFCFNEDFLARWREIYPDAIVRLYRRAGHYVLEDSWEDIVYDMETFFKKDKEKEEVL